MTKEELLLAGLAAAGENAVYTPVQVQKLFFLIDREAAHLVDGPHFDFAPYDYGPFDRSVYDGLDILAQTGRVQINSAGRYRLYVLSQLGFENGTAALQQLPVTTRNYLSSVSRWVRELSFQQLVASIYNRYPEMKVNSVFRE